MGRFTPDIIGKRFGRLVALSKAEKLPGNTHLYYRFKCDCGKVKKIQAFSVYSGMTRSCGCFLRERTIERNRSEFLKHGKTHTKEYQIWRGIKKRCHLKSSPAYRYYGKRGIYMCDRWLRSFKNFLNDMGERPPGKTSIDRINNNRGYYPNNCRWSDHQEQVFNRSNTLRVKYKNFTKTLREWSNILGIEYATLWHRLYRIKLSPKEAFKKQLNLTYRKGMAKRSKLGSGKRFEALEEKLEAKGKSPKAAKAIAASAGRAKYGAKKMGKLAAAGKKRASKK